MASTGTDRRERKTALVEEISTKLGESDAAVLTEYRGLTVDDLADLRGALRPAGTEYKVFKNTLARRAVESAGRNELLPMLEGPVAIAFVRGDAVLAAKALKEFGKGNPALVVKGGLLGGQLLSAADFDALADVPPREVLLASLAGGFQAPLVKAAGLFQAFTRNFAYGVQALIDQKGGAPEETAEATPEPAPAEDTPAETGAEEAPAEAAAASAEASDAPAEEAPGAEETADAAAGEAEAEVEAAAETAADE
jgi:large subunit ribosomal protein L10